MKKIMLGILIGILIALIVFWGAQNLISKIEQQSSSTGIEGFEITNQPQESESEEREKYPYLAKLAPELAQFEGKIEFRYNAKFFIWSFNNKTVFTLDIRVKNLSNRTITVLHFISFLSDIDDTFKNRIGNSYTDVLMGNEEWQKFPIGPGQMFYRKFFGDPSEAIPPNTPIEKLTLEILIVNLEFS